MTGGKYLAQDRGAFDADDVASADEPDDEIPPAVAPLIEIAVLHMQAAQFNSFIRWYEELT